MTALQKAVLSLLITGLLFSAFTALAFTGLFDQIEARFYNPTIAASITREVTQSTQAIDEFFADMQARFSQTLEEPAIQRTFLLNQSAEDIFERSRIYGLLHESIAGLQWVRFIGSGGMRIHFSTYAPDILSQDALFLTYRNFNEPYVPYEIFAISEDGAPKIIFDGEKDRIFFAFPFYDSFDIHRGTALFSLSARAVPDMLRREGNLNFGHDILLVSNPPGFLSGAPSALIEETLLSHISSIWGEGVFNAARLYSPESGISLTLLSAKGSQGFFVGRFVDDDLFLVPQIMKVILLLSFFLTVYLTIFLFFNLKQDSVTIIQNRAKKLQISLIEQYYEHKSHVDWNRWSRELEQRREEIRAELKRGITIASNTKAKDIDTLIDKSWDALPFLAPAPAAAENAVSAEEAGRQEEAETEEDIEELEEIREEEAMENIDDVEELEEVEALEELEELAEEDEADMPSKVPEIDIAHVASEIEFGSVSEPENPGEKEYSWEDFEVVSPFSNALSDFSAFDKEDAHDMAQEAVASAEEVLEELSGETDESQADELLPLTLSDRSKTEHGKKKTLNGMNSPQA